MKRLLVSLWLVGWGASGVNAGGFPYTLHWKHFVGDVLQGAVGLRDSVVFVGSFNGRLLAVRRSDGGRLWQRWGNGPLARRPTATAEELFYGDAWGRVLALRRDTGEVRWARQRLGWGEAEIVVRDSLVYVAGADGWLSALRRGDGSEAWRVRTGARSVVRPALDGPRLSTVTADGRWLILDAASGAHQRRVAVGGAVTGGPWLAGNYWILAGEDGYVRGYGRQDFLLKWERRLGARVLPPLQVEDEWLICAADNGWVYALRLTDGRLGWKQSLDSRPQGGVVRGPRGEVVVGTTDGRLRGLAPTSGVLLWESELGEQGGVRPYDGEDRLYVASSDGYLYAFGEPPALSTPDGVLWEDWWEAFSLGRKIGYRRRTARQVRFGERQALQFDEESVEWRRGFRHRAGQVWVDADSRPLAFARRMIEGRQVIEIEGRWEGDSLYVEQRLAGRTWGQRVAADRRVVLPEALWGKLQQEGRLAAGRRDSVAVFDYASLHSRLLYLEFEAGQDEKALIVRGRYAAPLLEPFEVQVWIDGEGRVVREATPLLESEQRRVPREQAQIWAPPGAARSLWLNYPLEAPAEVEELALALPSGVGEARRLFVEDERQRLARGGDGRLRLIVGQAPKGDVDGVRLPIQRADTEPYLQSSLYVQADDPRIQALAQQLRGAETDAWKVAVRLRQWVYDQMIPRTTQVRFKSALEVLEEMDGTCSEYTVLFMALCRAAGVPVRACTGFLVQETGELVLHLWTEVYVGRWVEIDPSTATGAVGAAHIRSGRGRLAGEEFQQMNLALQFLLAHADTLELEEYRTADRRFLAAAEVLFEQAREAEYDYREEVAQDLYHQLTLLPWNRRSGQAYVAIARYRLRSGELQTVEWAANAILRGEPRGAAAAEALLLLSRAAEARDDWAQTVLRLEELAVRFPDHELAPEALGTLGQLHERREGCSAALPYYRRLREEYSRSGWAGVAENALSRCRGME